MIRTYIFIKHLSDNAEDVVLQSDFRRIYGVDQGGEGQGA